MNRTGPIGRATRLVLAAAYAVSLASITGPELPARNLWWFDVAMVTEGLVTTLLSVHYLDAREARRLSAYGKGA